MTKEDVKRLKDIMRFIMVLEADCDGDHLEALLDEWAENELREVNNEV